MQAVVLATDPDDGNARGWRRELEARGIRARLLTDDPVVLPSADFVIAHLLLAAGRTRHPAWTAAERYEQATVPLLNSTATLALSADKLRTFRAWRAANLPQPRTWVLGELREWPSGPLLIKPALGESARGISVVHDRAAADAITSTWPDSALVQEALVCRSVLRVHATQHRVLGAFARAAAPIPGLPTPDPTERRVNVGRQLQALALAAVRALNGGLLGLDIIEIDGRLTLLEANPTFSLPVHLPELMRDVADEAVALCARTAVGSSGTGPTRGRGLSRR